MKKLFFISTLIVAFLFIGCNDDDDDSSGSNSGKTYAVTDFYDVDGVKGIVYKVTDGGKHGMILSLDAAKLAWQEEADAEVGASDSKNGKNNMNTIEKSDIEIDNFPAFKWCIEKKGAGWYIPSSNEALEIAENYNKLGLALMMNESSSSLMSNIWTSTEANSEEAFYANLVDKTVVEYSKDYPIEVRAVREF